MRQLRPPLRIPARCTVMKNAHVVSFRQRCSRTGRQASYRSPHSVTRSRNERGDFSRRPVARLSVGRIGPVPDPCQAVSRCERRALADLDERRNTASVGTLTSRWRHAASSTRSASRPTSIWSWRSRTSYFDHGEGRAASRWSGTRASSIRRPAGSRPDGSWRKSSTTSASCSRASGSS